MDPMRDLLTAPVTALGGGAQEIDAVGILRALRLAGERAFAQLPVRPDHVLLDGSYDWVSRPAPALFDEDGSVADLDAWTEPPPVTVRIKADMTCSSVAAASVLAKTTRDAIMVALADEHPAYGFEVHKGYASPEHREALQTHGPCVQHRRSWSIPGGYAAEAAALGGADLAEIDLADADIADADLADVERDEDAQLLVES